MPRAVIEVEGLGKRYVVGRGPRTYQTAREAIVRVAAAPFRWSGATAPDAETIWALKDVSFEVAAGDVLGIIGRNGAGKSTCLKILSRITPPTEGHASIVGRVGSLLEVGTGFHSELTGRENIFLNGAILGMRKAEVARKLDEIVAFAEVEKFLDTAVKHYSSGMYLRLAFAVAAHVEPEILLVDEVLAVGDLAFQKKCLDKMDEVGRAGRTVLFVSHNMAALSTLCTRGLLFDRGRIVAAGPIGEVIDTYIRTERRLPGIRRWDAPADAPGNEVVKLRSVRIISDDEVTVDARIDRDVWIEIVFVNYREHARLAAGIQLWDQMRTPVLATANMASVCLGQDEWAGRPYPAGLFRAVCRIPPNFLNEGRYSVTALVMTDNQTVQVQVNDVIAFTVHETGEMRREFTGRWIGVVRPRLEWRTEYRSPETTAWN